MPVKLLSPRVRHRLPSGSERPIWLLEVDFAGAVDPERLLAECAGFLVDDAEGHALGVVDHVELDSTGLVTALVVAAGWFGRRALRVPVGAIDSLFPRERRVVVRQSGVRSAESASR
jgi:hypothetical protein